MEECLIPRWLFLSVIELASEHDMKKFIIGSKCEIYTHESKIQIIVHNKDKYILFKGYIGSRLKVVILECKNKKDLSMWKDKNTSKYRRRNKLKDNFYYAIKELEKTDDSKITSKTVTFKKYNSTKTYIKGQYVSTVPLKLSKIRPKSILIKTKRHKK